MIVQLPVLCDNVRKRYAVIVRREEPPLSLWRGAGGEASFLHTRVHTLLKQSLVGAIKHVASRYRERAASQILCLRIIGYTQFGSQPLFRLVNTLRWLQNVELTGDDIHDA